MENQIVHEIQRNETEVLRVSLRDYKEKTYLDLRVFFQVAQGGEWIPTKKGLTVDVAHLSDLKAGIEKAEAALVQKAA